MSQQPDDDIKPAVYPTHVSIRRERWEEVVAERDRLRAALGEIYATIGPVKPECIGCVAEWDIALGLCKSALGIK